MGHRSQGNALACTCVGHALVGGSLKTVGVPAVDGCAVRSCVLSVCLSLVLQAVLLPLLVDIDRVGPEGAAALRR